MWRNPPAAKVSLENNNKTEIKEDIEINNKTEKLTNIDYGQAFQLAKEAKEAEDSQRYSQAIEKFTASGSIINTLAEQGKDRLTDILLKKGKYLIDRAKDLEIYQKAVNSSTKENLLLKTSSLQVSSLSTNLSTIVEGKPVPIKKTPLILPNRKTLPAVVSVVENLKGFSAPVASTEEKEFTHLTYTPITTKDPINFTTDGYALQTIQKDRSIDIFVVITMYNEAAEELNMTLRKLSKNIEYITRHNADKEGSESWKKICLCIVSDGRLKACRSTLKYAKQIGIFDQEVMAIHSLAIDVSMHLFEFNIQLLNAHKDEPTNMRFPPLQTIFALKEKNAGKLNSHLWFFSAFATQLDPKYTVLLDVGTMPTESAIFRLLRAMERNPQIGGCCGEIAVDNPNYLNFVVAAQQFEYKMSNILDKALESTFGYISVLPGAFSAYRFTAIRGDPLSKYFLSLTSTTKEIGAFKGNMYLAEDRILCFELIAKKGANWTLHYVKDALARTDVPPTLVALLKQRRRWLNGSLFAALYAIFHFPRIWRESGHSTTRKLVLTLQFFYLCATTLMSALILANFYLSFYFVVVVAFQQQKTRFFSNETTADVIGFFLSIGNVIYLLLLLAQFVMGMGNRPDTVTYVYRVSSFFWSILMGVTGILSVAIFVSSDYFPAFYIWALAAGLGIFFLAALIHGEIHQAILTFIQYFALLPSFVNIFSIYSFCNLHDLSWGTKGLEKAEGHEKSDNTVELTGKVVDVLKEQQRQRQAKEKAEAEKQQVADHFARFRSYILLTWMAVNGFFVMFAIQYWEPSSYLKFMTILVCVFNSIRFIGSTLFIIIRTARSPILLGEKPTGNLTPPMNMLKRQQTSLADSPFTTLSTPV